MQCILNAVVVVIDLDVWLAQMHTHTTDKIRHTQQLRLGKSDQVEFCRSRSLIRTKSPTCTYVNSSGYCWNANPMDRSMMDNAACVIAHQCSSTKFVSLPLFSRKVKFGIPTALSLKLRNLK